MVSHVRACMVLGMIVSIAINVGAHTLHTKDRDYTEIGQNSFEAQASGKEHFFSDENGFITKAGPTEHEHDVGSEQGLNGSESSKMTFVDEHPYVPPGHDDVRSPCPFMNIMANHGFVNHSGKDIDLYDMIEKSCKIFDFEPHPLFTVAGDEAVSFFLTHKAEDGVTELINLDRLWDRPGQERDASLVFKDKYFDEGRTVDQGLLNELLCLNPDSDFLTYEDLKQFGFNRIIDSRLNNPEFNFQALDVMAAAGQYWFPLVVSDSFDLSRVPKKNLNEVLGRNGKLPNSYIPRFMRDPNFIPFFAPGDNIGYPNSFEMHDNVVAALNANLTDYEHRRKENANNKVHHVRGSFHHYGIA